VRSGYVWLATFVACPLAAWPLLAHADYRRFSTPCRIGLAAAGGGVLISTWMTIFALVGLAWSPALLFAVSLLTSFLLRFVLRDGKTPPGRERLPLRGTDRAATALAALAVFASLLAAASAASTSPDLLIFWGPKAQQFARARTFDSAFLTDPFLNYVHPSYPPLVTNLCAFASMVVGRFPWGAATLTLPLWLAVLAVSLPDAFRRIGSRGGAAPASAFIVASFAFLGSFFHSAGNAEPWIWVFESLGMALLVGDAGVTKEGQLLAGLFLAGSATAKVEGLPFALAAALLFLVVRRREIAPRRAALFLLLPTVISLGAWFAFGATRRVFFTYEQYGRLLEIYWSQLAPVARSIGKALWSAGWTIPWLVPLAAVVLASARSRLSVIPLASSVILAAFFLFTYLHQPDASFLIEWSAGRGLSPLVAFLAAGAVCRDSRATAR
jgi:hypothetical protein